MRIVKYFLLAVLFLTPFMTYAAPPACDGCPITSISDIAGLITGIVEQLQYVFWVVAVGSALYAAFLYIRGGSNSETLKKAQKQILYTVIAVVLGLLANGIPSIVNNFLLIRGR